MAEAAASSVLPEPLPGFIARQLARAIELGEYVPGQRLAETAIAQRFGVSRAPVREALQILVKDELAVQRPRRGTVVIQLTTEEIAEMFEVRSALYAAIARLFTRRATDAQIEELAVLRQRIADLAQRDDVSARDYVQATQAHSSFKVAYCGNTRLQTMFRSMTRQAYRFYAEKAHSQPAHRRVVADLTQHMLDAVRARDAERASMVAWRITEANQAAALAALAAEAAVP